MTLDEKLHQVETMLRSAGGCAVAFSGGVDSSVLLAIAHYVLGEQCLAVIATSSTYPQRQYRQAIAFVEHYRIRHEVIISEELEIPGFRENPPDRCYHCKKELFAKIRASANRDGLATIADGTNADDTNDYRPGVRAADEFGVLHPLRDAKLTKNDIRALAKQLGLSVADQPASACLASRFPYGSMITAEKLRAVEAIENLLNDHGFVGSRARHHGTIVRIELPAERLAEFVGGEARVAVITLAKSLGFPYVTVDIEGFRSGSMNETLARRPEADSAIDSPHR